MPDVYDPEQLDKAEKAAAPAQPRRDPYSRSTKPGRIRYSSPKEGGEQESDAPPGTTSTAPGKTAYKSEVPKAEQSLYTSSTSDKGRVVFGNFFKNKPRAFLIGGVATGGIAGISVALFLTLLPLKVLHIVQNLENRYFATSSNAVQKETDSIMSSYFRSHVFGGLSSCQATIDITCKNGTITGKDKFAQGFRALAGQDENGVPRFEPIEHQIAREKGLQIKLDTSGGTRRFYMSQTGVTTGKGLDITDLTKEGETVGNIIDRAPASSFNRVSTKQFKQTLYTAYQDETYWKRVMIHVKVQRLLTTKYGTKWFFPDRPTPIKNAKNSFKIFAAERFYNTQTSLRGIAVICLIDDSDSCDIVKNAVAQEHVVATDGSGCQKGCDTNGAAVSDKEKEMQKAIDDLSSRFVRTFDQKELDKLQALYKDMNDKGLKRYFVASVTENFLKFFLGSADAKAVGGKVGDYLPFVGAANRITSFVDSVNKLPPKIQKFNYILGSTAMIEMFNMYRTYADQMKHGDVSAAAAGTFADSLGPNYVDPNSPEPMGGSGQAETTPLYQTLIGGKNYQAPTNNTLGSLFSSTAYAATTAANSGGGPKFLSHTCADGNPVPTGKLICPEHNLLQFGAAAGIVGGVRSNPIWGFLTDIANGWRPFKWLITAIASAFGKLLAPLLGILSTAIQQIFKALGINEIIANLVNFAQDHLLPFKTSTNQGGGTNFEMAAGGAEGAGYDYCHTHLGCVAGTDQQIAKVWQEQSAQDQFAYSHQSFFARMFDTTHDQSPMVKLALAMPTNSSAAVSSTMAKLSNPFKGILGSFGSIFSFGHAQAATAVPASIFGHTPYYYPPNDPVFSADPQKFWLEKCVPGGPNNTPDYTADWNKKAAAKASQLADSSNPDPNATLMPENDGTPATTVPALDPMGTNPCLLLEDAMASVAGTRSTAVFAPGDLQTAGLDTGGGKTATPTSSTCVDSNGTASLQNQPDWAKSCFVVATDWYCNKPLGQESTAQYKCPNEFDSNLKTSGQHQGVLQYQYSANGNHSRQGMLYLPTSVVQEHQSNPTAQTAAKPLVIYLHGRGLDTSSGPGFYSTNGYWPAKPAPDKLGSPADIEKMQAAVNKYGAVVVDPQGQGRVLGDPSYGWSGQIDDLAKLTSTIQGILPWLNIDPSRVYIMGASMGGQEGLMLAAQHSGQFAGVYVNDPVTDLAAQHDHLLNYDESVVKTAMVPEVGGPPSTNKSAYDARSPLPLARASNLSTMPIRLDIDTQDEVVQMSQKTDFYNAVKAGSNTAPIFKYECSTIGTQAAHHAYILAISQYGYDNAFSFFNNGGNWLTQGKTQKITAGSINCSG